MQDLLFDFLPVVSFIVLIVIADFFILERRKTKVRIGDPNKNLNDRINHMHDVFNRNQKKTDETLLEHVSVIDEKYQDVSNRIATGQAYVALSRSSPLDGLHLLKEINSKHVAVDSDNKQFYLNARPV